METDSEVTYNICHGRKTVKIFVQSMLALKQNWKTLQPPQNLFLKSGDNYLTSCFKAFVNGADRYQIFPGTVEGTQIQLQLAMKDECIIIVNILKQQQQQEAHQQQQPS